MAGFLHCQCVVVMTIHVDELTNNRGSILSASVTAERNENQTPCI